MVREQREVGHKGCEVGHEGREVGHKGRRYGVFVNGARSAPVEGKKRAAIRLGRAVGGAVLLGMVALCATPGAGRAAGVQRGDGDVAGKPARGQVAASSPITLQVAAGYQNIYRGTAWTPVRVVVRNRGGRDESGLLELPQAGQSASVGAQADYHGLYQAPVVVPADSTRRITLYVPGAEVQGQVDVNFRQGNRTVASASVSPIGIDTSAFLIGVLAGAPADMGWIGPAIRQQVTTHVIRLSPATIDAVPQALATFDLIVVTDVDTSQLDVAQRSALARYVRNGGSILLVGGPTWQETLRPLQTALLSGQLAGLRTLPNLTGLRPLALTANRASGGATAVSVLAHPGGTVLAAQSGIPLVVRATEGQGSVEYVAFDPSLNSIQTWSAGTHLLNHLVAMAAPRAIARTWAPGGFRARFQSIVKSDSLTGELANLPTATVPFLALFAGLTLAYVLILGPANFWLLRRWSREHLAWVTIPLLAVSYVGSILGITTHLRAESAIVNTVGLITLDGTSGAAASTMYLGLATPQGGEYHLAYPAAALPAPLPVLNHANGFSFRSASTLHATPLGMRLQEDPQPTVTFVSMKRWTMRDLTLESSAHVSGAIQSGLTIDPQGDVVGRIHNGTNLDLLDPVILAGQTVARLATIPAGGSVYARVRPGIATFGPGGGSAWDQLYGGPAVGTSDDFGGFGGFGDCCNQAQYSHENQLIDRIRNAVAMLSQAQPNALSALGAVVLVGWSERPLAPIQVDGSAPQRRDLNAIVTPLSVQFPTHGTFRLLTGTLGASLVDILPRAPQSNGFGFGRGGGGQPVASVAPGGFLTFEFDLPRTTGIRFGRLTVNVGGGDEGASTGRVYDWNAQRWIAVDLSSGAARLPNANRFVSSHGQIMVRLLATGAGGDLTISDPYHDIQISGTGTRT